MTRAVLGGIPDGRPLARLQIDQARAYAEHGIPIEDRVTQNYVTLSERVPGNDLGRSSRSPRACGSAMPIRIPRNPPSAACAVRDGQ